MLTDWHFYALAIPAVILLGLAKGGFAGMGALSLPMLTFAIDPVRAAAILLPILIAQDVVGVWAFRRTVEWKLLGWMMPGAVLGIWLGYAFAASVSPLGVMVKIRVLIGVDGRVKAAESVSATSDAFFEATRRQALSKWRFKPATRGGIPQESWKTMSVRFEIKNQ